MKHRPPSSYLPQPGRGAAARLQRERQREDPRIRDLEWKLINAEGFARKLWAALKARRGEEWDAFDVAGFFGSDGARVVDAAFEAAEKVWEKSRISIYPCSRILDGQEEGRDFIAVLPDGELRNLSRQQLLMMAGMDPGL
jgi:hypothetical protein